MAKRSQEISALSIARPLLESLVSRPFSGRVLGRFARACNLVDGQGWVIALTLPELGQGPFSIVMEDEPGLFQSLRVDQAAYASGRGLVIGDWRVKLSGVKVWEPRLAYSGQRLDLNRVLATLLSPYTEWPLSAATPVTKNINRLASAAAARLKLALIQSQVHERAEVWEEIEEAVRQLAGLGSGLTPMGDDYLVGVMAALWISGYKNWPPRIASEAAPKTTALSAAFLQAAGRGEFIEPWHQLAQALFSGTPEVFSQALRRVAQFGASSGVDALAGFATTVLSLKAGRF